jgi:hypothetical protein
MERTESHDATEAPPSSAQLLTLTLEMHWKTLEILACHGEIPAIKIGKRWLRQWTARLQPVVDWFITKTASCERAQAHSSEMVHRPSGSSETARGCKSG